MPDRDVELLTMSIKASLKNTFKNVKMPWTLNIDEEIPGMEKQVKIETHGDLHRVARRMAVELVDRKAKGGE